MQLYSPNKAAFDAAIPFLWLMAVSTTACAAVWTAVVVGEEVKKKEIVSADFMAAVSS